MQNTVQLIWILAALMACWSFSLLVRWIAELGARTRSGGRPGMSRARFLWCPVLIVVSLGCAATSGWLGVHIMHLWTNSGGTLTNIVVVTGLTVCLFAGALATWAAVGDRARGRQRCPKCWYDMSAASTERCPECGHAITHRTQLLRTRRPRCAFVAAALIFAPTLYTLFNAERIQQAGAFALVPSSVLMLGWDRLDQDWILDDMPGSIPGNLEWRLEHGWITGARQHRFARMLCEPLLKEKSARTDRTRLRLIWQCRGEIARDPDASDSDDGYLPPPIDPQRLLMVGFEERIAGLSGLSPNTTWNQSPFWVYRTSAYGIASYLTREKIRASDGSKHRASLEIAHTARLREVLEPVAQRVADPAFLRTLEKCGSRSIVGYSARIIAEDSGALPLIIDWALDPSGISNADQLNLRTDVIAYGSTILSGTDRAQVMDSLRAAIKSSDLSRRALALKSLILIRDHAVSERGYSWIGHPSTRPVLDAIVRHAFDDRRQSPGNIGFVKPIASLAAEASSILDPDGDRILPHTRWLIDQSIRPLPNIRSAHTTIRQPDDYVRNWVRHLGDLIGHPDPSVRAWLIRNRPETVPGAVPEFDRVVDALINDESQRVGVPARDAFNAHID